MIALAMPSERVQRRIDQFLDEAEEALSRTDWETARQRSEAVLSLDPENEDASTYLAAVARGSRGAGSTDGSPPTARARSSGPPEPEHPDSFVGGRYRVERFLGEGGKKRVFLAHDTTLDRDVAFGQFRTEGMDAAGRARVTQEAQAMGRVGAHPNLVNIYDIGEEAGAPYIVQEYVSGGSLAELVAEEPPPLARTLQLAQDVCSALSFIHEQNLVHRDIKPSNVFLTEDGSAKVGDFGLAVGLDRTRITMQGGMIGTPSYMPPEQALAGDVTPQSDLYSLGAMLYELVTGRPPFVGDDPTSVISQHINTPPVAPSWHSEHCPPELEELILRCLAKAPDDRPASAEEAREALARVDPLAPTARHSDSGANPLDRLARGVFVGRDAELERLRSAFDDAFAGRGSLAMLVGEPGIGKTRTAQELETYARMRGAQVFVGRTHESAGMPAYWPWIEIGNAWAANDGEFTGLQIDPTASSQLLRIFPGLAQLAPNIAQPAEIAEPEVAQFRLLDAYTAFIRAVSERAPVMLVIDDLHWADRPSLQLLQHLARSLSRMRVLVIGTFRDTDIVRASALSETLAALNREPGFERIVLRGLTRDEVASYIRSVAHFDAAPGIVNRIHEETEGIPFFLSEVVQLLTEEGRLEATSVSDIALPDGVREALGRRLDRLSEEANELLQIAAVSGREFRFDTLAAVSEHDPDALTELLEQGLRARVIEETGSAGQFRFVHALMQETLLDELSTTRRVRLHSRIGEALEARWGERAAERATRLAQHFVEAATLTSEHAGKALKYSVLAAEQAEVQSAWGAAARHYDNAFSVIENAEAAVVADEAEVLRHLGRCLALSGDQRGGFRNLMRSFDLARERGDGIAAARAAVDALWGINLPAARRLSLRGEALTELNRADPYLEAQLLVSADDGDRSNADRVRQLAEEHGYEDILIQLERFEVGPALWSLDPDVSSAARSRITELRSRMRGADQLVAFASTFVVTVPRLIVAGDLDAARAEAALGLAAAEDVNAAIPLGHARHNLACLALLHRDMTAFDENYAAYNLSDYLRKLLVSRAHEIAGNLERAVEELPTVADGGRLLPFEMMLFAGRARCLLAAGRSDQARESFEAWRNHWESGVGVLNQRLSAFAYVAESAVPLGGPEIGAAIYEEAEDWDSCRVGTWSDINLDRARGRLAFDLGRVDDARRHFETGLAWSERDRCPIEIGLNLEGLTDVSIEVGDTAAAAEYLDRAQAIFAEQGANLYLDRVLAKKLELQGGAGSDSQTSLISLTTSIEEQRPDVATAVAPDGTVTLLFSDIEDSTAMNVELGDDAWMQLLGDHNRLVREAIREHGGFEVKTEGDAFMVAFQSARDAVRCAQAMQRALDARSDEPRLRIRIGMHTGEPVREEDDFYGTHVVLASRICSHASGGEILVSSLLRDLVASSGEFELTAREPVALKGLEGEHVTYVVGWGS
jgi:class 3 adenylate cyclase/Cdc6-like AAA superfamily ATPase